MMADIHLPIKPRSDIALINGIAHVLIHEGLINREYIAAHTNGFEEFAEYVSMFHPGYVAKMTGLSEETVLATARLYGNAKAAFIGWTMGVNHSTQGAAYCIAAISNLLAAVLATLDGAGASPILDHAGSEMQMGTAGKRSSPPACPAIASSICLPTVRSWQGFGRSMLSEFPLMRMD